MVEGHLKNNGGIKAGKHVKVKDKLYKMSCSFRENVYRPYADIDDSHCSKDRGFKL